MPAFTLYAFNGSTNADRVRLTLAEGGFTDYEFKHLDFRVGEHKSPEYLRRHPWGKVPAITFSADNFTLYESRAICKYLATIYSIPLLPPSSDAKATALFDQAQSVETLYFAEHAGKISFEKFAKEKFLGLPADETVVQGALKGLEAFFGIMEGILGERKFMAGDEFGLVDVFYVPSVQRLFQVGYGDLVAKGPNVSAWWERCTGRPAIKKMMDEDREKMEKMMAAKA